MQEGWIKIHRQIIESEIWTAEKFSKAQAWTDLLLLANHKPQTIFIRGIEIRIERGQLAYSQLTLAKRWKWNFKTVVKFLEWLENRQMVETKTDNKTTVITIKNYHRYQSNGDQSGDQNGEQKETKTETNKNDKNIKNEIKDFIYNAPPEKVFAEFKKLYPCPNGKFLDEAEALRRFRLIPKEELPLVLEAVKNFASSERAKKGIGIKDPKNFLGNQMNERSPWKEWIEPETENKQGAPHGSGSDKKHNQATRTQAGGIRGEASAYDANIIRFDEGEDGDPGG